MSAALRSDEYVVITSIGGKTRSLVWDARKPLALGHPMRWVLEKTSDGGFCVRDLGGGNGEVISGGVRRFGPRELANRAAVPLPDGRGRATKIQATLQVEAVRPIAPPYLPHDPKSLSDPQTFVFAGVRKTVISTAAVQAGYAAYAGTRPAFIVNPTPNGFKLKPLMDHLSLTPSRGAAVPLIRKESINLSREEVLNSTVTHGQYWWKFGLVSNPGVLPAGVDIATTEDASRFRKAASAAFSLWALFLLLMWMMPATPKEDKPPEETPIVKFEMPKRNAIAQERQKKPEVTETEKAQAAAAPVEPQKAPEAAKEPEKKAEEKKPEAAKVAEKAPEKAEPVKTEPKPSAAPRAKPKIIAAAQKATARVVNKAKEVVESAAQVAAKARTKMLRDLLGGAAHGLAADHKLEAMAGKAGTKSAASAIGDIGAADGAMAAPTEIKPTLTGSGVKVGSLGGKDSGAKDGSTVSYAVGEHASVQGQGGSFVSMNSNGASVDEGLTKEEVGAVIHSHMGEIRYCHEASMLANPTIQGKLVLQFTITAMGTVESVGVASTTIPDAKLPECVVDKLRTWRFPHPKNGVKVSVAYPFLFKTLGRE